MSQYNVDNEVTKELSTRGIGRYEVKVVVLTMHKEKQLDWMRFRWRGGYFREKIGFAAIDRRV